MSTSNFPIQTLSRAPSAFPILPMERTLPVLEFVERAVYPPAVGSLEQFLSSSEESFEGLKSYYVRSSFPTRPGPRLT